MAKVKKIFSIGQLKIGDEAFNSNIFNQIVEETVDNEFVNEEIQQSRTTIKCNYENRFISFYIIEGGVNPRPETVFNTTSQVEENNPRNIDQIEKDVQVFILIDVATQRIFMSDFRRKHTFAEWLADKTNQKVVVSNIIDREGFIEKLKSLKKIRLSAAPNLFSELGSLGQFLKEDIHNYGTEIEQISLSIKFQKNFFPQKLRNLVIRLMGEEVSHSIDKLEISGRSDENFDRVFNAEEIVDKAEIDIFEKKDGLLDPETVFSELILRIKQ